MAKTISDALDLLAMLDSDCGEFDRDDAGAEVAQALEFFYIARRGYIIEQMKPMKYDDPELECLMKACDHYEKKTKIMKRRAYERKLESKWVLSCEECVALANMVKKMIISDCKYITEELDGDFRHFVYFKSLAKQNQILHYAEDGGQELKKKVDVMMTFMKWSIESPAESEIPTL